MRKIKMTRRKTDMVKDMPIQVKVELGLEKAKTTSDSQKKAFKNYMKEKKKKGFSIFNVLCSPELRTDLELIKSDERISTNSELLNFLKDFYEQNKGK